MMVDLKNGTGVVLEVNSRPHITSHLFPMEGTARDIPKAVIDYYFPDTEQPNYNNIPLYYFDIKTLYDAFNRGICTEFTIPNVPQGKLTSTRLWVEGVHGSEKYTKWVKKKANELRLHGYIKHLANGYTSIVVSGKRTQIEQFKNIINNDTPNGLEVQNVTEKSWKKPIKIGFEIKSTSKIKSSKSTVEKETNENII